MDVLKGQDIVLDAIHDWIREDAPKGIKMMMTPELSRQLAERVVCAFVDLVQNN